MGAGEGSVFRFQRWLILGGGKFLGNLCPKGLVVQKRTKMDKDMIYTYTVHIYINIHISILILSTIINIHSLKLTA